MELRDINQSWTPPTGFYFVRLTARGAYLLAEYHQPLRIDSIAIGYRTVVIYINNQGREVMRTENDTYLPVAPEKMKTPPQPIGRWFRFKDGFYLVLIGLQEMLKCLRK